MSTLPVTQHITSTWWYRIRSRLTAIYLLIAALLLLISFVGSIHYAEMIHPGNILLAENWWQIFGYPSLAGLCWLCAGYYLLATAKNWIGGIEGISLLPAGILLLQAGYWGNPPLTGTPAPVIQLLWIPSFALLGATLIHFSLLHRPETLRTTYTPNWKTDGLPYLPVLLLIVLDLILFLLIGHVPLRLNMTLALGYSAVGGLMSLGTEILSLLRAKALLPTYLDTRPDTEISPSVADQLTHVLPLWISATGITYCLGILPQLFTGTLPLSLSIVYTLATIYPFLVLATTRTQRLIARLNTNLDQHQRRLRDQQERILELQEDRSEFEHATARLLYGDTYLRGLVSQRIHDQPKQQALRIRALLGHWQHKLRIEAERNGTGKVEAKPIVETLSKIRKISEELENDLRGLQMLVEDTYQRQSLGLKLHLEKLIREDLPMLHPASPLHIQDDLWALEAIDMMIEQTDAGEKIIEAIAYTVTQALLNIYQHAGANYATVRTIYENERLDVQIEDDGKGFDAASIETNGTSLFKARLKVRAAGGSLLIQSVLRPQPHTLHNSTQKMAAAVPEKKQPYGHHQELTGLLAGGHGTLIELHIPLPGSNGNRLPQKEDTHSGQLEPQT